MKLRAAVIVDNLNIARWQEEALIAASEEIEIVMLINCQNTSIKRNYFKNFLYYLLNIFSLRNHLTKTHKIRNSAELVINFDSIYEGIWQLFPLSIYESLRKEKIDVVIKFGMNLLRIDEDKLSAPILSYHHGDPSNYRGRPAGFYEILNGEKMVGIIVQVLCNKLDAGKILTFASSKVVNYSYKKTAINLYSNSKYLLKKALVNLSSNQYIQHEVNGKNYRLPSNLKVFHFSLLLLKNSFSKIFYGLFYEKIWRVAVSKHQLSLKNNEMIDSSNLEEIPLLDKYTFYADPFFSIDGRYIRFEALNSKTGLGNIVEASSSNFLQQRELLSGQHFSYPYSFIFQDKEYLLPEEASHSSQSIYCLNPEVKKISSLKGLEGKKVIDATLFFKDDCYFLFFGEEPHPASVLNLWYSEDSPVGIFYPHPMNPIVVNPSIARMGGKIAFISDKLVRFGQNNSGEYGESLAILEIVKLTKEAYEERQIGEIKIEDFKGPHTLNLDPCQNRIIIDYYTNQFSFLAGIRRIKAKLKASKFI